MNFDNVLERIKKATGARTQVELASILSIRQSSISDAKRRNSVPADWYLKLYRSHGLNPDWLSDGIEPMYLKPGMAESSANFQGAAEASAAYGKTPSRSRVVNVSSMAGLVTDQGGWQPDFVSQLSIPETLHKPSILVVRVDGAGMEPLIRRGAYVGLDSDRTRVRSGEIYGIHVPHEGLVLKRVFFDADNDRFLLRSENPEHPEQSVPTSTAEDKIVGRVVWLLQEF
ncbi:phage C1 repressor [Alkalidesulfovibrio alkalitolerans DSM 16529]|jgi:phage repressor protein C with HTH and peptisase S24 domain|uniref:Phage C1 repressor n=1 Tax=Alkalidesulfovibrio alkalitolerans DSM 16529 TaxID=1121439 RepID=S7THX1_9BACT|nr:S24 family peptidase [Alkalidesulfovibrio alkalitolerans]EPR36225.1 phage C1 repressor [Alkalidesulfovibrio alkalitolerans DSM 16529]